MGCGREGMVLALPSPTRTRRRATSTASSTHMSTRSRTRNDTMEQENLTIEEKPIPMKRSFSNGKSSREETMENENLTIEEKPFPMKRSFSNVKSSREEAMENQNLVVQEKPFSMKRSFSNVKSSREEAMENGNFPIEEKPFSMKRSFSNLKSSRELSHDTKKTRAPRSRNNTTRRSHSLPLEEQQETSFGKRKGKLDKNSHSFPRKFKYDLEEMDWNPQNQSRVCEENCGAGKRRTSSRLHRKKMVSNSHVQLLEYHHEESSNEEENPESAFCEPINPNVDNASSESEETQTDGLDSDCDVTAVKMQPPSPNLVMTQPLHTKPEENINLHLHNSPSYQVGLQEFDVGRYVADLVMWKDTPRSALLFGVGAFCVMSLSFAGDLHFSMITVISYLALFYLAVVFFYKTILQRGSFDTEFDRRSCDIISETHILSALRSVLPIVNLVLGKFQQLFSGDPATTIKLALALWFFANCGHRMTMATLMKLGFFAMFTIPKLYSCYSPQLYKYGHFMLCRFWDAWNNCSHKKSILLAISFMAWNLSTVSTRIWGAFILVVAFYVYHQSAIKDYINQNEFCQGGNQVSEHYGDTDMKLKVTK